MRPGSVATAGAASGRPSHHHAAATASAVRMKEATSFRMKIPCYADGFQLGPFEPARDPPALPGKRGGAGGGATNRAGSARRRTHSIDAPRRNPPATCFRATGCAAAHANAAQPRRPKQRFHVKQHDTTGQNSQLQPLTKGKFGNVIQTCWGPRAGAESLSAKASTEDPIVRPMFLVAWRFLAIVVS